MKMEIQSLSNGTILLNGYPGYLATNRAIEVVEAQCGVEITLEKWEVLAYRFKIGQELVSSFKFRPKKGSFSTKI